MSSHNPATVISCAEHERIVAELNQRLTERTAGYERRVVPLMNRTRAVHVMARDAESCLYTTPKSNAQESSSQK